MPAQRNKIPLTIKFPCIAHSTFKWHKAPIKYMNQTNFKEQDPKLQNKTIMKMIQFIKYKME